MYFPTIHEHMTRLTKIFKRLYEANLKIQPDKCEFLRKEVTYLGHTITKDSVKPNPAKIECIQNFPQPKTSKDSTQNPLPNYFKRMYPSISIPIVKIHSKN